MLTSPAYLIDRVLPSREVSLVTGRSGAGKTRWMLSMLVDWQRGVSVLGHSVNPVPWTYVSADRSRESVTRNCREMGIDPDTLRIMGIEDIAGGPDAEDIVKKATKAYPDTKLWVMEAFSFLTPSHVDFNSGRGVFQFLRRMVLYCKANDVTVLGVTLSPKPTQGDERRGREAVLGAVAWGAVCETVFRVDESPRGADYRRLYVFNHNDKHEEHDLTFNSLGRLVEVEKPRSVEELLLAAPTDIGGETVKQIASQTGVSIATVYRKLSAIRSPVDRLLNGRLEF